MLRSLHLVCMVPIASIAQVGNTTKIMVNTTEMPQLKIKIRRLCSRTFSRKSRRLWDIEEKYCTAGEAADDTMVDARCMLDTQGYKHTLKICNTHCFSTITMAKRARLSVTLHLHRLPCFLVCRRSIFCRSGPALPVHSVHTQYNSRNQITTFRVPQNSTLLRPHTHLSTLPFLSISIQPQST
jgi:hypothetical protein